MFKLFSYLFGLPAILFALFWGWQQGLFSKASHFLHQNFSTLEIQTLEARYSVEQIMETQKKQLIKDTKHVYLESSLEFYPYALLEIKYSKDNQTTSEGVLLWSLLDAEIVLDTATWKTSCGFQDCLVASADKNDFKLIKILSKQKNFSLDREHLLKELHIESDFLDVILESAKKKQLVVQRGNFFRLHFSQPRFPNLPETKMDTPLVSKLRKEATSTPKKYSIADIEKLAKVAFQNDFAIRSAYEVYLPVYSIVVQNPDGSLFTTHWNALNGKMMK